MEPFRHRQAIPLSLAFFLPACATFRSDPPDLLLDTSYMNCTAEIFSRALIRNGLPAMSVHAVGFPRMNDNYRVAFNCLTSEERCALTQVALDAKSAPFGEALLKLVLFESESADEVVEVVSKFGADVLNSRTDFGGREVIVKAHLIHHYSAMLRDIPVMRTATCKEAGEALLRIEETLERALQIPALFSRDPKSVAADKFLHGIDFNRTFLRVEKELLKSLPEEEREERTVLLARMVEAKLRFEAEYGLLLTHTISSDEVPVWKRHQVSERDVLSLLDIEPPEYRGLGTVSDPKRMWRSIDITRMHKVLNEASDTAFPKSAVQLSPSLWRVMRAGASQNVLGMWSESTIRIFDGAVAVHRSMREVLLNRGADVGQIFLHEIAHAIVDLHGEYFQRFVSSGNWQEYPARSVGAKSAILKDGSEVSLGSVVHEGQRKFRSFTLRSLDTHGRFREETVIESDENPPVPPGFTHHEGASHLPVYCVLEAYNSRGNLDRIPEPLRAVTRTWLQRRPLSD